MHGTRATDFEPGTKGHSADLKRLPERKTKSGRI
jgi:hypothetical protein